MTGSLRERWWKWNHNFEKLRVKVIASVACSFFILICMAPFFVASYRLHLQRQAIETVVAAANLVDRDPISVALRGLIDTCARQDQQILQLSQAIEQLGAGHQPDAQPLASNPASLSESEKLNRLIE